MELIDLDSPQEEISKVWPLAKSVALLVLLSKVLLEHSCAFLFNFFKMSVAVFVLQ